MYSASIFILVVFLIIALNTCSSTPLDDYVNTPDPVFSWKHLQTYPQATHTLYVLNMTSQQWFDDKFSSRPIWWHYVTIVVPRTIRRSKTAFLFVDGGQNTDGTPTGSTLSSLAVTTGSITVSVKQVPNQPIRFLADTSNKFRTEDSIIAWTWDVFFKANGTNPNVLLQLPMTKAVIRTMDTTEQFLQQQHILVPEKFILSGASKRGWATWLAAAVNNKRVSAAIPLVMDLLNLRPNMKSHYRSLGGWTHALKDYYGLNITRQMDNPFLPKLTQIVDPYFYFDRYVNMKIFQGQGSGDEFFLVDSEDFFWNDLQAATGGSYLRRIPNVGHGLAGFDESLMSFYLSVSDKQTLPSMKWTRTLNATHGQIRAVVDFGAGQPKPTVVVGYRARTSDTSKRDFRQSRIDPTTGNVVTNPVAWSNTAVNLESQSGAFTVYSLTLPMPPSGYWDAAFIQVTFPGPDGTKLILTTETLILPNTYPVSECFDQGCYGKLV